MTTLTADKQVAPTGAAGMVAAGIVQWSDRAPTETGPPRAAAGPMAHPVTSGESAG